MRGKYFVVLPTSAQILQKKKSLQINFPVASCIYYELEEKFSQLRSTQQNPQKFAILKILGYAVLPSKLM
jgi:hypothetical protein